MTFEAVAAAPAGDSSIAAIAAPVEGISNVYIIDIATGAASFVANAVPGKDNIPFSADDRSILWTDGYCGDLPGMVTLFNRVTGTLTHLDLSSVGKDVDSRYALLAPGDQVAIGSFGATYLIDRDTLAFRASVPNRANGHGGNISWSSNYRYASRGIVGRHGGRAVARRLAF